MDPESDVEELKGENRDRVALAPPLSQWTWRPWYAKLWWLLIPIYWAGAAIALQVPLLGAFYSSAVAGVINIFMLPPTALMLLSVGYVRERFEPIDLSNFRPIDQDELQRLRRGPSGLPAEIDPLDPRSGALWIGSPLNPTNRRRRSY